MPSLFNPYVLLAFVFTIFGAFAGGYYAGENDEQERQQIEIAALNTKAREAEQRMADVAQTYAQTLRKANDVAKSKETKLRIDLASGERKLFIPVKAPECAIPAAADSPAPSGGAETRAELDGRTAQALVDLTSRGDQAIRSLNTCIDQYNQMRSQK
jgi:hypothetical protein